MIATKPNEISKHQVPCLHLDQVCYTWPGGTKALDKCTFSIPKSGLWMLVGKNGSGKSTLFRVISRLIKEQSGEVNCPLKTALVFQNPDHQLLLPTCLSDLMLSIPKGLKKEAQINLVKESLAQVELTEMKSRPIHTLSGGQKQRLAIAGALASQAKLLLLDEPTALLDPVSQKIILQTVWDLCHRPHNPITALWITHRLSELDLADGAATMQNGKVSTWKSGVQLKRALQPLAARRV